MKAPNYPGFHYNDPTRTDFRKNQYFQVNSGLMKTPPPSLSTIDKHISEHTIQMNANPAQEPAPTFAEDRTPPAAMKYPVLRFFAFFRQEVNESIEETFRVRYVSIHVYVEDDTIMINETKMRNSGMDQGTILRRMRVPNPQATVYATPYTYKDFRLGVELDMFGTVFHICSCDPCTKDFFAKNNLELGSEEQPPDDMFSIKRKLTERPIRVAHIDTDKMKLKQFLAFDGKVLSFNCFWDDRKSLFGEFRSFILHYFLVDGTIEIVQALKPNSGREPTSRFLMKALLKKPSGEPYTDADLRIGTTVNVFGREFQLCDADAFTKHYIDEKFGPQDWSPVKVEVEERKKESKWVAPQFNGWGDEVDSLGYCKSLHPKPPVKNVMKLIENDGKILRWSAKFSQPNPQDRFREFVIAFYMADDTVEIFEKIERNSGFRGGKFVQRSRQKKEDGSYFGACDFRVGEDVVINGFVFAVIGADDYTMNFMEANPDQFPQSDLFSIVQNIDKTKTEAVRKQFESVDPELNGYIDEATAKSLIEEPLGLAPQAWLTVARRFNDNGKFDYFAFFSAIN